jgi:hypothetical protein
MAMAREEVLKAKEFRRNQDDEKNTGSMISMMVGLEKCITGSG